MPPALFAPIPADSTVPELVQSFTLHVLPQIPPTSASPLVLFPVALIAPLFVHPVEPSAYPAMPPTTLVAVIDASFLQFCIVDEAVPTIPPTNDVETVIVPLLTHPIISDVVWPAIPPEGAVPVMTTSDVQSVIGPDDSATIPPQYAVPEVTTLPVTLTLTIVPLFCKAIGATLVPWMSTSVTVKFSTFPFNTLNRGSFSPVIVWPFPSKVLS